MYYQITYFFYILILSLFLSFLYIFLFKKIRILSDKNKFKECRNEIDGYIYILNNLMDGIAIIDREKHILFVNDSFGKNIRSLKTNAGIKEFDFLTRNLKLNSLIDDAINDYNFNYVEKKISYYDRAEEKIVDCKIFKIGQTAKYAVIIRDITYLQKIENIRAAFIQNISHELKTPITAIAGFAETLKNGAIDNPDVKTKFISIIEHHAKRLNYLIDDLIILTNIESEKYPVKYETVYIKLSIDDSLILFEQEIKDKNIAIINNVDDVSFISDTAKINQIITNLVQNAVKYVHKGGIIKIRGYIGDSEAANDFISDTEETSVLWDNFIIKEYPQKFFFFSIEDNGMGVNYTNLLMLGERFFRVDSSHSSINKGTGLGLAIVKQTLKLLNGSAVIKSVLGNGFSFSLAIPVK